MIHRFIHRTILWFLDTKNINLLICSFLSHQFHIPHCATIWQGRILYSQFSLYMDAFHMLFSFLFVCFFWSLKLFRSETIIANSDVLRQLGIHQHSVSLRPAAPSFSNCTLPSIIPSLIAVGDSVDCKDCFPPSATSNSRIDVSYSPSLESNVTTGSLITTLGCSFRVF